MGEPWGLSGPEFLALYWEILGLAVVAVVAGAILARRRPARSARLDDAELDAYELAMLAGGPKRVEATAIAGLVASEALRVSRHGVASPTGLEPRDEYQRFVLDRIGRSRQLFGNVELGLRYSAVGRELVDRLVARGYLVPGNRGGKLHWIIVAVGVFGVVRLINGVALDRPVGWLFLSLLATAGLWFLAWKVLTIDGPFTTRYGKAVLARAQARAPRADFVGAPDGGAMTGAALLGGVALYGLAVYPDEELSEAMLMHAPNQATASSGGCGSAASSCSSGGGGGCGGGCGGGG